MCVGGRGEVCAANLLMVGLKMHHNGLIYCGGANGSSPGFSYMVETRKGRGEGQGALELALQAKRVTHAYTSCIKRTKQ